MISRPTGIVNRKREERDKKTNHQRVSKVHRNDHFLPYNVKYGVPVSSPNLKEIPAGESNQEISLGQQENHQARRERCGGVQVWTELSPSVKGEEAHKKR